MLARTPPQDQPAPRVVDLQGGFDHLLVASHWFQEGYNKLFKKYPALGASSQINFGCLCVQVPDIDGDNPACTLT